MQLSAIIILMLRVGIQAINFNINLNSFYTFKWYHLLYQQKLYFDGKVASKQLHLARSTLKWY